MKVVLIFPGISDCGFNTMRQDRKFAWINHGLASISACAKKEGHKVDLVDLRRLTGWQDLKNEVMRLKPRVAGITMMSVDYDHAMKAAEVIKGLNESIVVVAGGPHPTLMPEEVLRNQNVDHVVRGEGELSFVDLLNELEKGRHPPRDMQGLQPDLDSIPFIDRELFKCEEVPIDGFLPRPFVTLIAGRGCIYNCSFCQPAERILFGRKVRRRSPANVVRELENLRGRYNFSSFMLHDDCLTEDEDWVLEFCSLYRKGRFNSPFACQSRVDIICKKEEMVRDMKRAGLAMFLIGFESGNQRILNFLRKGTTVEQNFKAAKICKRYGIRIWANYMLGIPTETKEEALDTLRMIKRIKPYRASPAFFTPHPGSDLYEYCKDKSLSLIKDHGDYSRSPSDPKVKGIDYVFLNGVLEESRRSPLSVKFQRRMDSIFEKKAKKYIRRFFERTWRNINNEV